MREAPSIYTIKELVNRGAKVKVFDPKAMKQAKTFYLKNFENVEYAKSKYDVFKKEDALILLTERKEFRPPDFKKMKDKLKNPIIF